MNPVVIFVICAAGLISCFASFSILILQMEVITIPILKKANVDTSTLKPPILPAPVVIKAVNVNLDAHKMRNGYLARTSPTPLKHSY